MLLIYRRLDKSNRLVISAPACINMRMAVGAVYQTVTLYFSMILYQLLAEKPPS